MTLWRQVRNINLAIPEELLAEVDASANENYMSRTEYIRHVLHKEVSGTQPKKIKEETQRDPWKFIDLGDS